MASITDQLFYIQSFKGDSEGVMEGFVFLLWIAEFKNIKIVY